MEKPVLMKNNDVCRIELMVNFKVVDTFDHDWNYESKHMKEYIRLANERKIPYQMLRIDYGRAVIIHNGEDAIWYSVGFKDQVLHVMKFNIKSGENYGKE